MSVIAAFKRLLKGKQDFSELELSILTAVREQLAGEVAQLWDKQVAMLNKIQRSPDGLEVNFYPMKGGKPNFDMGLAFADKSEDFHLATVDLVSVANAKIKLRARVWCVQGHLFMIKYLTSYREFERIAHGEWQVRCRIENKL